MLDCDEYTGAAHTDVHSSWIGAELRVTRNSHHSFHTPLGTLGGMVHTALASFITKGKEPWTLHNNVRDCDRTKEAALCPVIEYPKADGKVSFDLLTNLQRSGTAHEGDQPAHLRVKEELKDVPSGTYRKRNAPSSVVL